MKKPRQRARTGWNAADVIGGALALAAAAALRKGRRYGGARADSPSGAQPEEKLPLPLRGVQRFAAAGFAALLTILIILLAGSVLAGPDAESVLLAATVLAETQFLVNVLHDYEAPGWWALSAISGLLPLGVVFASALPPDGPRDLITLISTVVTLAGFAVITVADGRGVFVTEWTWWATERWRGQARRDIRLRREALEERRASGRPRP